MKLQGDVAKRLTLRLDAEQWRIISAVAKQLDLTPAEVMRGAIFTLSDRLPSGWSERARRSPPELVRELNALRLEVNKFGVNVNQAVRLMYMHDQDGDTEALAAKMREVSDLLDMLVKAVNDGVDHHR